MDSDAVEHKKSNSLSVLSMKRLNEIRQALINIYGEDHIDDAIKHIVDIMKFNPDYRKGMYTKEKGQKMAEYKRRKAAEQGKSIYEVFSKVKST